MRTPNRFIVISLLIAFSLNVYAFSIGEEQAGIYKTKHNLLRGIIMPEGEEKPELCIWCHIPHDSLSGDTQPPKWLDSSDADSTFMVYGIESNATVAGVAGEPDVMVRVCLTCHDGVNAPNISLYSEKAPTKFNINSLNISNEQLPKDALVHSHPVGVNYAPFSKSGMRASLRPETYLLNGWSGAKSIKDLVSEGTVRCTSCHDPHTTNELFLRTSNNGSRLCKGCHDK